MSDSEKYIRSTLGYVSSIKTYDDLKEFKYILLFNKLNNDLTCVVVPEQYLSSFTVENNNGNFYYSVDCTFYHLLVTDKDSNRILYDSITNSSFLNSISLKPNGVYYMYEGGSFFPNYDSKNMIYDTNIEILKDRIVRNDKDNDDNNDNNGNSTCKDYTSILELIERNTSDSVKILRNLSFDKINNNLTSIEKNTSKLNSIYDFIRDIKNLLDKNSDKLSVLENNSHKNLSKLDSIFSLLRDIKSSIDKITIDNLDKFFIRLDKIIDLLKQIVGSMTTLDRDDDHPMLFSIRSINDQILQELKTLAPGNKDWDLFLKNISNKMDSMHNLTDHSNGFLENIMKTVDSLRPYIVSGSGSIGDIKNDGLKLNINNSKLMDKLDDILNALKAIHGSEEDLNRDFDELNKSLSDFVNQDPFGSARHAEQQLKNYSLDDSEKLIVPEISIGGQSYKFLDLSGCSEWIPVIREILVATLYISLFIYLIRVFIPRLKV